MNDSTIATIIRSLISFSAKKLIEVHHIKIEALSFVHQPTDRRVGQITQITFMDDIIMMPCSDGNIDGSNVRTVQVEREHEIYVAL